VHTVVDRVPPESRELPRLLDISLRNATRATEPARVSCSTGDLPRGPLADQKQDVKLPLPRCGARAVPSGVHLLRKKPTSWKERFFRLVPALDSLRHYTKQDARSDVLAGLTVATVAVPQAMAYALIIGLPPIYGLYTAIVMTAIGVTVIQGLDNPNGMRTIKSLTAGLALTPSGKAIAIAIGIANLFITAGLLSLINWRSRDFNLKKQRHKIRLVNPPQGRPAVVPAASASEARP